MNQMKSTLSALVLFFLPFLSGPLQAQSYAFGVKGGPAIGFQRWGEGQRDPLWAYHVAGFIESAPPLDEGIIYAQAGYHVRGSAIRFQAINVNNIFLGQRTDEFKYNNLSLAVGFKKRYGIGIGVAYYLFGLRGDYTIGTNLKDYEDFVANGLIYPTDAYVRKFNYGLSLGGGWEIPLSDFVSGVIELSFHPDFSRQYDQPSIPNVIDPFFPGTTRTIPDRRIVNYTGEISFGFRFLREIEYYD